MKGQEGWVTGGRWREQQITTRRRVKEGQTYLRRRRREWEEWNGKREKRKRKRTILSSRKASNQANLRRSLHSGSHCHKQGSSRRGEKQKQDGTRREKNQRSQQKEKEERKKPSKERLPEKRCALQWMHEGKGKWERERPSTRNYGKEESPVHNRKEREGEDRTKNRERDEKPKSFHCSVGWVWDEEYAQMKRERSVSEWVILQQIRESV